MIKNFAAIILLLIGYTLSCFAQSVQKPIPDFNNSFKVLEKNRELYNLYNDSILIHQEHDEWVNFFRHRSAVNHQIYTTNKKLLDEITDYFQQAPEIIPDQAYTLLYNNYKNYHQNGKTDIFITETICDILDKYYKHCPDSLNHILNTKLWRGNALYHIWSISKDPATLKKSYDNMVELVNETNTHLPEYEASKIQAIYNLVLNTWLVQGLQDIKEFRHCISLAKEVTQGKYVLEKDSDMTKLVLPILKDRIKTADENLLRNIYMKDTTIFPKSYADSLMNVIVLRNLKNKNLNLSSYLRTLIMQTWLKQITMEEALTLSLQKYESIRQEIHSDTTYKDLELQRLLQNYINLLYINDEAHISQKQKRKNVLSFSEDIITAYTHRKDQQIGTAYIRNLIQIITYDRFIKYLNEKERIRFLDEITVRTQVSTYAHTQHVAQIAKILTESIIDNKPELLLGAFDYRNVNSIKRHKREILDYIYHAALYHDLGKNAIGIVVNNDYRPLTDHEFKIIKMHPELGLQFIDLAPSLSKYRDTTLGHHKWYNGKGGYPESFDNMKSKFRIMIDIVTFSDCMQAATERLGRNYKKEKTFEVLMSEFRKQAGIQINPDLVSLVDEHSELAKKLEDLVNDGWLNIYYDIYSQFFNLNVIMER